MTFAKAGDVEAEGARAARALPSLPAAVLLVAAGCGLVEPAPQDVPGIRVISAPGSDTIEAALPAPLIIEARDAGGLPFRDGVAVFTPLAGLGPEFLPEVTVAPLGVTEADLFSRFVAEPLDTAGRASVQVRLGSRTPEGRLLVTIFDASGAALADTVAFAIEPGAGVGVGIAPKDTTVYLDRTLQLRGGWADRHGNVRVGAVTYQAGSLLSVTSTGVVTAAGYTRSWVVASGALGQDTGYISVVPHGWALGVMAYEGGGPFVAFELDGSRFITIPSLIGGFDAAPAWAPDGAHFAYSTFSIVRDRGGEVFVADTAGSTVPLLPAGTFRNAAYPRYSADGEWIYFSGQLEDQVFRLWRVHPDGTGAQNLGMDLGGGGVDWRPDVAPDGTRLVFITMSSGDWVARTVALASGAVSPWALPGIVARWSPRGDRIALMPNGDGPVLVVTPDGTGSHPVTPAGVSYGGQLYEQPFDWSPDGEWLIVSQGGIIRLIEVDTGLLLPLAWSWWVMQPTWHR